MTGETAMFTHTHTQEQHHANTMQRQQNRFMTLVAAFRAEAELRLQTLYCLKSECAPRVMPGPFSKAFREACSWEASFDSRNICRYMVGSLYSALLCSILFRPPQYYFPDPPVFFLTPFYSVYYNSSSFLGVPYRILYMNPKKELLWSLCVYYIMLNALPCGRCSFSLGVERLGLKWD